MPAPMNRNNIEEIKARLPIEDLLSSYLKLEKSGKSLKAKCPFHHEKTASFFVSPERGGYYCFGCGAKGDIFTFVEQFEGLDFKGTLKVLAERAGVKLTFDQKGDNERDRLFEIMEEATKYFEAEYTKSTGPGSAQEYIHKRGVTDKTRAEFRIGFAPLEWRNLHTYLRSKNYPNDLIEKAGLAKRAEDNTGNYYDRFRGRIMFPISDSSGRVIAFTGRILVDDGKSAKYLNSPDMPLFDKSSVLYGLDKAKSYIRRLDYSILVEGQMDLIMSHQAGVKNTVAASGTALTDTETGKTGATNNLGLLKRLSGNVIIAFDSDAAGKKAAMRAAGIALSIGMDVKIADIKGGKDPADLVAANPEDWKNVLRATKPIIEFELGNVINETPDKRKVPKALRDRVFPFIAQIESQTDKAYFVRLISDRTDLLEQAVWDDVRTIEQKIKAENTGGASAVGTRNSNAGGPAGSGRAVNSSGPANPSNTTDPDNSTPTSAATRRLDLVERRMFGLLDIMRKAKHARAEEYAERIKKTIGISSEKIPEIGAEVSSDMSFEAEAFFGNEPEKWDTHMNELIANFEEDIVNKELIQAMNELRQAERNKDQTLVDELGKKCQALSVRKAVLAKNKK